MTHTGVAVGVGVGDGLSVAVGDGVGVVLELLHATTLNTLATAAAKSHKGTADLACAERGLTVVRFMRIPPPADILGRRKLPLVTMIWISAAGIGGNPTLDTSGNPAGTPLAQTNRRARSPRCRGKHCAIRLNCAVVISMSQVYQTTSAWTCRAIPKKLKRGPTYCIENKG